MPMFKVTSAHAAFHVMLSSYNLIQSSHSTRGYNVVYWPPWEMHCNNLTLVLGLGLVRVSSRVRVSVMVRVSLRTSWVVNFALFRCYWPVIYTRPTLNYKILIFSSEISRV